MFVVFLFIYFWEDLTHCELIFFSLIFINRFFKKKTKLYNKIKTHHSDINI